MVKAHCALELGYEGQFIFAQESHQEDKTSKEKFQFPICVFKSGWFCTFTESHIVLSDWCMYEGESDGNF